MAKARGYKCVFKVGSSTLGIARNVEPTFTAAEQDITSRASDGWDEAQPGRRKMTARIESLWVPTDAALSALLATYTSQASVAFTMTDENGAGWSGTMILTEFTMGPQDLDNAVMCSCSIRSTGTLTQVTATTTAG